MRATSVAAICLFLVRSAHAVCSDATSIATAASPQQALVVNGLLNIPTRRMWGWGNNPKTGAALSGFCGEMAVQTAALYYGNYISEQAIRNFVLSTPQNPSPANQLLLGVSDVGVASALSLAYTPFAASGSAGKQLIAWAAPYVQQGAPVSVGVYDFGGSNSDYDHIVLVRGVSLQSPSLPLSAANPVVSITLNDALNHAPHALPSAGPAGGTDPLYATRSHAAFPASTSTDTSTGAVAAGTTELFLAVPLTSSGAWGGAFTGVVDPRGETFRTMLQISGGGNGMEWSEPDWSAEDGINAAPVAFSVTAVIFGLTPGARYAVLRFDSPAALPRAGGFYASGAWSFCTLFTAPAASAALPAFDTSVRSDGTYFYRTVLAPVPAGSPSVSTTATTTATASHTASSPPTATATATHTATRSLTSTHSVTATHTASASHKGPRRFPGGLRHA